ncbi:precorrin-3B synthase [Streptomyces cirratus]|uniref:Precorrin-3B synthase n=1 Tax=Streptomyces cirratus TaxID=68187 RepID=A0ABQ3F559_9ACTN|nr:cobalamin biosynthesis protein CobG [Streptomyces cirratus]GHB82761.1 precorrin-3B synthase [Streptomyces cirratus]
MRLHPADDGFLARVRIPGGMLGARAAGLLAGAADRLGDGHIDLTSRGNVQLRGLGAVCGGELAGVLTDAGLLPAASHERVRNVVASPLTGLDRSGLPDVAPWVAELDRLLCGDEEAVALSGRFLFALDDGRGDVSSLDADVNLLARGPEHALLTTAGARDGLLVSATDAPRAALLAARYFLDAARQAGTRAWRVAELDSEHALQIGELAARLDGAAVQATVVSDVPAPRGAAPEPGLVEGHGPSVALSVLAPLGRLTTAQWNLLAGLAGLAGQLRLTPWRGIVVPGLTATTAPDALAVLADAGLITTPADPRRSVTACTGRPGCARSHSDVRADARAVTALAAGPLPVHWSGCERRCGHPRGTGWADVLATPDGYDLRAPGRAPRHGLQPSDLAAALSDARRTTSHDAAKK